MRSRLKEVREARGLSQQDLAERVGTRRQTIIYLEKEEVPKNPSLMLVYRIAQVLETPIEQIFALQEKDWPDGRPPE